MDDKMYNGPRTQEGQEAGSGSPGMAENGQNTGYGGQYGQDYSGPGYQGYPVQGGYRPELEEPIKVWEWALYLFLSAIPCVGIIMAIVWGFSKTEKKSKSNFFKAMLILQAAGIIIGIFVAVVLLLSIADMMKFSSIYHYYR